MGLQTQSTQDFCKAERETAFKKKLLLVVTVLAGLYKLAKAVTTNQAPKLLSELAI